MKKTHKMNDLDRAYYKAAIREKVNNVKTFMRDNKEILIVAIPAVAGVCKLVIKSANKHTNLRKEKRLKDNYCYDRSLGHYWELNRKLTNDEWIEVEKRKGEGECMGNIFLDMGVLRL